MVPNSHSEQRALSALSGEPEFLRGISFVPAVALVEALGLPPGVDPLVAVCEALDLDFAFVRASDEGAEATVQGLRAVGTAALWAVDGPFGLVASERGWAAALADVVRDREGLARATLIRSERIGHGLDRAVDSGATAVVVAEDLALATGLLMGPDDALDIMLPALAAVAAASIERGLPCIVHTDGDVRVFLDKLGRDGFAGIHMGGIGQDLFEAQYGLARDAGLAVLGGLSGPEIRRGPEGAVEAARDAESLGRERGLLVADDGGLTTAQEMTALVAGLEALRQEESE